MSFSQQAKQEIISRQPQRPCCVTAACYGVACFSKYFDAKGIVLHTEKVYIAQWAKALLQQAGILGKVYVKGQPAHLYEFAVKDRYEADKALALFAHTGDETALRINQSNFVCSECFAAFLASAFLCCGTITNPQSSYALEFVSGRHPLMTDFAALLSGQGFTPGRSTRKGLSVLYFKASEQIEDLLTTMGASHAALDIMRLKVFKDHRNHANRVTNCETANIDKTVAANRQVLQAIRQLEATGALPALPQPLQDAAALRKAHPALSLAELVSVSPFPLSKSGLNHRLRKLCEKAAALSPAQPANHP